MSFSPEEIKEFKRKAAQYKLFEKLFPRTARLAMRLVANAIYWTFCAGNGDGSGGCRLRLLPREPRRVDQLDELSIEIDGLVTHAVRHARRRTTNTRTMTALLMAIDSARAAVAERRRGVLDEPGVLDGPKPVKAIRSVRVGPSVE